jgi:hypothetical protein
MVEQALISGHRSVQTAGCRLSGSSSSTVMRNACLPTFAVQITLPLSVCSVLT